MGGVSTAKIVLFHQGSTELRRCENCVFFLPVNILTGVARRLLGPHDTLPCVLIPKQKNLCNNLQYNFVLTCSSILLLIYLYQCFITICSLYIFIPSSWLKGGLGGHLQTDFGTLNVILMLTPAPPPPLASHYKNNALAIEAQNVIT